MNEMVETVARALCLAEGHDLDRVDQMWGKHLYRYRAKTAIEAMRAATPDMVMAGFEQLDREPSPHAAEACWTAMIDAALK